MNAQEVIIEYKNMVYGIAMRYMRNQPDAEDVFANVFLKYVKAQKSFESEEHRKYWLIRVTINESKTMLKKRSMEVATPDEFLQMEPADSGGITSEEKLDLYSALGRIKDSYREVIELHYMNGLTMNEIADALDVPYQTVNTRLRRARDTLRQELGDKY